VTEAQRPSLVVVIEDDADVRAVAVAALEVGGMRVLEADGGVRGLAVLRDHAAEVDAILLDLHMPDMGGEVVLEALRETLPTVPVVIFSGYASRDVLRRVAEIGGPTSALRKPFRASELIEHMKSCLDG